MRDPSPQPPDCNAALVLADGTVFWGRGFGMVGASVGEVCFNTAMTGYQEILTDPSYAAQIITFTFPHIGNVGTNLEDVETVTPAARGLIVHSRVTGSANWRAMQPLDRWVEAHGLVGLAGVDTRRLTRLVRDGGPPNGVIAYDPRRRLDIEALRAEAAAWPGLEGMDLAREVSCRQSYEWNETPWRRDTGYGRQCRPSWHVVAIDYGAKRNILRLLAAHGCRVTVVPATASAEDVLLQNPDGIFLSNGPGDPAATGDYALPVLRDLIASEKPIFGICLGHQLLALALGGRTRKMARGHRGANHPVKDLLSGKVEITSQNHGFVVDPESLPTGVEATHMSLFDGSNEGLRVLGRPIFSVQYHPEASPGPQDSHYLFDRFIQMMEEARSRTSTTVHTPIGAVEPHRLLLKQPEGTQKLYKIIRVEYLIDMLRNNYLYFQRVDTYNDDTSDGEQLRFDRAQNQELRFEKEPAYTVADYHDGSRARTYACCFSLENSSYIWKEYGKNRDAVCLVFEFEKLRETLNRALESSIESELLSYGPYRCKQIFSINYGVVEYVDRDIERLNISRIANPIQYTFIKERANYEKEQELRIALSAFGIGIFALSDGTEIMFPPSLQMHFDFRAAFAEGIIEQVISGNAIDVHIGRLKEELQKLGYGIRANGHSR